MFDKTKLNRDYDLNPLTSREPIPKVDLEYLYIELNYCFREISGIIHKSENTISRHCKKYGLLKSKELHRKSMEDYYLRTIGVRNPALLQSSQEKKNKTMMERYGVENIAHSKDNQEKKKQTCLEKYGVDNVAKSNFAKEKSKRTNLEKYGKEYHTQSEEIKAKKDKTMLERYGCLAPLQNKAIKKKQEETCLERYGTKNPFQNKSVQDRQKATIQQKYGVDNAAQTNISKEHYKNTCLEKYGTTHVLKNDVFLNKQRKTIQAKYGVDNISQNTLIKAKKKHTCLEKYGVENPCQVPEFVHKIDESKTKNGTHNTSKDEEQIFVLLLQKFNTVERQYKTQLYPFKCDFYIPEIDLFLEYQGYRSHGGHPFDITNPKDVDTVNIWKQKSQEIRFDGRKKDKYLSYINTWTVRDPIKRQWAKDHNLNYLEFFNMDDFMKWYITLGI